LQSPTKCQKDLVLPLLPLLYTHLLSFNFSAMMTSPPQFAATGHLLHGMISSLGTEILNPATQGLVGKLFVALEYLLEVCNDALDDGSLLYPVGLSCNQLAPVWLSLLSIIRIFVSNPGKLSLFLDDVGLFAGGGKAKVFAFVEKTIEMGPTVTAKARALEILRDWSLTDTDLRISSSLESKLIQMYDKEPSPSQRTRICSFLHFLVDTTPTANRSYKRVAKKKKRRQRSPEPGPKYEPPPLWRVLDVFKRVAMGARRLPSDARRDALKAALQRNNQQGKDEQKKDDVDIDDGMVVARGSGPGGDEAGGPRELKTHTRILALNLVTKCLRLSRDGEYKEMEISEETERDHVISVLDQISDAITIGCMSVAQASTELATEGLKLLCLIVDTFGTTVDPNPDMMGNMLLDQYIGQLTSTVRTAMKSKKGEGEEEVAPSPYLFCAGLNLAKALLPSILRSDKVVISRLLDMMKTSLNDTGPTAQSWKISFNGSLVTRMKLVTLRCLVKLCLSELFGASSSPKSPSEEAKKKIKSKFERDNYAREDNLKPRLEEEKEKIFAQCVMVGRDHAVVSTQPTGLLQARNYQGIFFSAGDSAGLSKVFAEFGSELVLYGLLGVQHLKNNSQKLSSSSNIDLDEGGSSDDGSTLEILLKKGDFKSQEACSLLKIITSACVHELRHGAGGSRMFETEEDDEEWGETAASKLKILKQLLLPDYFRQGWIDLTLLEAVLVNCCRFLAKAKEMSRRADEKLLKEICLAASEIIKMTARGLQGNESLDYASTEKGRRAIHMLSMGTGVILRSHALFEDKVVLNGLEAAGFLVNLQVPKWKGTELNWRPPKKTEIKEETVEALFSVGPELSGEETKEKLTMELREYLSPVYLHLLVEILGRHGASGNVAAAARDCLCTICSSLEPTVAAEAFASSPSEIKEKEDEKLEAVSQPPRLARSVSDAVTAACLELTKHVGSMEGGEERAEALAGLAVLAVASERNGGRRDQAKTLIEQGMKAGDSNTLSKILDSAKHLISTLKSPAAVTDIEIVLFTQGVTLLPTCTDPKLLSAILNYSVAFLQANSENQAACDKLIMLLSPMIIAHLGSASRDTCLAALKNFQQTHSDFAVYARTLPQAIQTAMTEGFAALKEREEESRLASSPAAEFGDLRSAKKKKSEKKKTKKKKGKKKKKVVEKAADLSIDFSAF